MKMTIAKVWLVLSFLVCSNFGQGHVLNTRFLQQRGNISQHNKSLVITTNILATTSTTTLFNTRPPLSKPPLSKPPLSKPPLSKPPLSKTATAGATIIAGTGPKSLKKIARAITTAAVPDVTTLPTTTTLVSSTPPPSSKTTTTTLSPAPADVQATTMMTTPPNTPPPLCTPSRDQAAATTTPVIAVSTATLVSTTPPPPSTTTTVSPMTEETVLEDDTTTDGGGLEEINLPLPLKRSAQSTTVVDDCHGSPSYCESRVLDSECSAETSTCKCKSKFKNLHNRWCQYRFLSPKIGCYKAKLNWFNFNGFQDHVDVFRVVLENNQDNEITLQPCNYDHDDNSNGNLKKLRFTISGSGHVTVNSFCSICSLNEMPQNITLGFLKILGTNDSSLTIKNCEFNHAPCQEYRVVDSHDPSTVPNRRDYFFTDVANKNFCEDANLDDGGITGGGGNIHTVTWILLNVLLRMLQ